ncbi:MAG: M90 family metallopeptidase [Pseudomonadota bacterium]
MIWVILLAAASLAGWFIGRKLKQRQERAALLTTPLTDEERAIIIDHVPLFERLPDTTREKAEGKINLLMDQVEFYGCDGLEVTEDMALSIAAQAAILVAENDAWYSTLRTILLYPGAFKSRQMHQDGYVVTDRDCIRTGESWYRGPVILSWADSEHGAFRDDDGHNVVFHEFAHQLDDSSGATNGMPLLNSAARGQAWVDAFSEAFERNNRMLEIGKRPFLDPYGATAPEELFAVATENFFERPVEMQHHEGALYDALKDYFQQDPASWS